MNDTHDLLDTMIETHAIEYSVSRLAEVWDQLEEETRKNDEILESLKKSFEELGTLIGKENV